MEIDVRSFYSFLTSIVFSLDYFPVCYFWVQHYWIYSAWRYALDCYLNANL